MQVHQYLLVCAIFCAQLFGDCVDNEDCSDKVYCTEALIEGFITTPTSVGQQQCECNSGFDAIDLPFMSGGDPFTVCTRM